MSITETYQRRRRMMRLWRTAARLVPVLLAALWLLSLVVMAWPELIP